MADPTDTVSVPAISHGSSSPERLGGSFFGCSTLLSQVPDANGEADCQEGLAEGFKFLGMRFFSDMQGYEGNGLIHPALPFGFFIDGQLEADLLLHHLLESRIPTGEG